MFIYGLSRGIFSCMFLDSELKISETEADTKGNQKPAKLPTNLEKTAHTRRHREAMAQCSISVKGI